MTNSESRQILIDYNAYWDGKRNCTPSAKDIGLAINAAIVALGDAYDLTIAYQSGYFDGKRSKSSIAQAIRDAAVNWPQFLGDVESEILDAFIHWHETNWADALYYDGDAFQSRTFMLLVAEALES